MQTFYVDESGYTGFDLLNDVQRFQGASAISISEEEARRTIDEFFPMRQGPELKYSVLARRKSNRERVVRLLQHVVKSYPCVTYVCDKRYLLTMMFLDFAVEPFYYAGGVNFYKDGQHYAMGSMLYLGGPGLLGEGEFFALLAAFQAAIKFKTPAAIEHLLRVANSLRCDEWPEVLGPISDGNSDCIAAILTEGVTTDAALVVLQAIISRTEEMAGGPYRIEHDRSKNLEQYNSVLKSMIDHRSAAEFRTSEIASLRFPLKLAEVVQVDSASSPAIQLADVLIGSAIDAANQMSGLKSQTAYAEEILTMYRSDQFIHLTPSLDFEAQRKFRQGSQGNELIDYFATHLTPK